MIPEPCNDISHSILDKHKNSCIEYLHYFIIRCNVIFYIYILLTIICIYTALYTVHTHQFVTPASAWCSRNWYLAGHSTIIWFFVDHVSTVASSSCSYLSGVELSMLICCCSPFVSWFNLLCIQICSSARHCCKTLLFQLFCYLEWGCPFSSGRLGFCPPICCSLNVLVYHSILWKTLETVLPKNPRRAALSEILDPPHLSPAVVPLSKSLRSYVLPIQIFGWAATNLFPM